MRSIIFVIGTRAQLVKVAPVIRAVSKRDLPHVVWFTGQHQESIDDLIADFGLESSFVMPEGHRERATMRALLGWLPRTFVRCRQYIQKQQRNGDNPLVVVHGDTLSTLLGAAAARLAKARVVHLESGLTSGSVLDPFPEELLRRLTFHLADYALCPNAPAAEHMRRFAKCMVVNTRENTLLDSVRFALERRSDMTHASGSYYVASIHRFQNLYRTTRLAEIVANLVQLSEVGTVYFVMHPATERRLRETGLTQLLERSPAVRLVPRMPYTRFLALLAHARGVVSDGGSNQEELSYLGVPTVLYRERTERPDGIGQNIVFEKDLPIPLAAFAGGGGMDRMRTTGVLHAEVFPSDCSARALANWVSG